MSEVAFPNSATVNVMDQVRAVIATTANRNGIGFRDEPDMELVRVLHLVGIDTKAFPEQGGQITSDMAAASLRLWI